MVISGRFRKGKANLSLHSFLNKVNVLIIQLHNVRSITYNLWSREKIDCVDNDKSDLSAPRILKQHGSLGGLCTSPHLGQLTAIIQLLYLVYFRFKWEESVILAGVV